MNLEIKFQALEHKESRGVISFNNGTTFKISKFMETINNFFKDLILINLPEQLKKTGLGIPPSNRGNCSSWSNYVDAEILEPQSGEWKKGKVRMRVILEFCPDEPEEVKQNNSLDDIRQTMTE